LLLSSGVLWKPKNVKNVKTKNWKKFTAEKNYKNYLGLHKGYQSYKRSLQLSKENTQHYKA
jgi:hypothetical protein